MSFLSFLIGGNEKYTSFVCEKYILHNSTILKKYNKLNVNYLTFATLWYHFHKGIF